MNGQMTKYEKYIASLKDMEEPNKPFVRFNMRGLIEFARKKGVKIAQLSDEEKRLFVTPI